MDAGLCGGVDKTLGRDWRHRPFRLRRGVEHYHQPVTIPWPASAGRAQTAAVPNIRPATGAPPSSP
jgi:hypothetical protein